jgi:eukaryotic-like serine/threonine-protein kinase
MVWPPPRIQATPEGQANAEPSEASRPDPAPAERKTSHPPLPPSARARAPQPTPVPDTATSVARDWLALPESLIGSVLGGRYRITGVLGRGPMGIACEGESSRGRHVTLKLLPRPSELPVEHFAWQVRQTLALAHFDHPNVSPINDFGALDDGSAFVSRSRVPGTSLRIMLRQGALPVRRALELGRQVALALSAAHAQDIAHGRLKPENILVQTQPAGDDRRSSSVGDQVKVVDFGMAELPVNVRAVTPDENQARRLLLEARVYQPRGSGTTVSPAGDIYSLGVILFEMIAGQPPFAPESIGAAGPEVPPITFSQCDPPVQVSPVIADLVMSLLHPRAALQGVTASHLVNVLDVLLARPNAPLPQPAGVTEHASYAPRAGAISLEPPPPTVKGPPPDLGPISAGSHTALAEPLAPGSGNRVPSWPPLPQGFSTSSFPPPPSGHDPEGLSIPSSAVASGDHPPGPFPPAAAAPHDLRAPVAPNLSSMAPPSSIDFGDEVEFRPSLLGRLRRLFGGKRGGDGL